MMSRLRIEPKKQRSHQPFVNRAHRRLSHFPMQNSLKILPSKSSVSCLPTTSPIPSRALRKSTAISSGSRFCPIPSLAFFRSEEHTSELQSHSDLVCRLLLEKKKTSAAIVAGRICRQLSWR